MSLPRPSPVRAFLEDESGQTLPVMVVILVVLLGMCALVVDIGRGVVASRKLQAATDAAALAGAQFLPATSATSTASTYSALAGSYNNSTMLHSVTMVTGYPKLECLTTLQNQGIPCIAPANANAVEVQQQATLPMYFAALFGRPTMTLTATSTAAMRGGAITPYNVAVIIDATLSQDSTDDNCGAGVTEMTCALSGVQAMLQTLSPCQASQTTCTISNGVATNSVDRVALFTFPNVSVGTASIDSNCTTPIPSPTFQNGYYNSLLYGNYSMMPSAAWSGVPSALPYSFPTVGASSYNPTGSSTATYQLTPFVSDYRTSDTATSLNGASALVKAVGGVANCGGMLPPNYDGNYGTFYAGVIYAAQAALAAEQAANPGSQNVMILLSDGDATAPQILNSIYVMPSPADNSGKYPSYVGECGQAVKAAQYATNQGTRVYSIGYGSEPTGCASDQNSGSYPNITPCTTMLDIASSPQLFYSDYLQSGSGSNCIAPDQPDTNLSQIFADIANDLTFDRLIPNTTQ
jgi:Flp pilus assembly protein TadG